MLRRPECLRHCLRLDPQRRGRAPSTDGPGPLPAAAAATVADALRESDRTARPRESGIAEPGPERASVTTSRQVGPGRSISLTAEPGGLSTPMPGASLLP